MIQLSDHFTYKRLLRFVASPIFMMIVCSIYSVVDGLFVSNFAGDDAFAALNLIFPLIMVLAAVGFMFGSGGTAIVSKTMGEGDNSLARKYFTLIVTVAGGCGVVLAAVGILLVEPVAIWMGASGDDAYLLPLCKTYGTIILCALPFFILQNMYQSFFTAAEKPKLGFVFTLASGVTNMILDALFIAVFKWGLVGAAVATALAQATGGIAPTIYFCCKNSSRLRFSKTKWYGKVLVRACTNGISELLGNIAMSFVGMLYNKQLMAFVGKDGVNAYGVIMYVQFIFVAVYIGYCIGVTPIVGFNFGAQNREELQNVFKKSLKLIAICSVTMTVLSVALAVPIAKLFVGYSQSLFQLTVRGMMLFAACYLFAGFNMFASCFFTALNNGLISLVLSFGRTLVFQVLCIYIIPLFLGVDGIWISTAVAELLSAVVAVVMFASNNKRYGYIKTGTAAVTE